MSRQSRAARGQDGGSAAAVLAITGLITGLLSLLLGASFFGLDMFASYFGSPLLVLLNLLPPLIITFFVYFACGRAWASFLITALITLLLSTLGYYRLAVSGVPLRGSDLMALPDIVAEIMDGSAKIEWRVVAAALYTAAGTYFVRCLTGRGLDKARLRLVGMAALLLLSAALYLTAYRSAALYDSTICSHPVDNSSETQRFIAHGFVYPFLYGAEHTI